MWELGECFSGGLGSAEHGDLGGLFSNLNDSVNQWKLAESKTCPSAAFPPMDHLSRWLPCFDLSLLASCSVQSDRVWGCMME